MREIDIATGVRPIDGTDVDKRKRLYLSVTDALESIPYGVINVEGVLMVFRYRTLTVPVLENGEPVDYWFKDGVEDIHFVKKTLQKDEPDGIVGLTGLKINFKNVLNTITSFFTNSNTVSRTYTFPDKDGTVALDSDLDLKANQSYVEAAFGLVYDEIDELDARKVDKQTSALPGRVIFVAPDGGLVGDGSFTYDSVNKVLNVNGAVNSSSEFKIKVRGRALFEGAGLFIDNPDGSGRTTIELSGGRSALKGHFNGIDYRLGNNDDATGPPDTSKSFRWFNRGLLHFQSYSVPLEIIGGIVTQWEMVNEFHNVNRFPHVPANGGGSYKPLVLNEATKRLETVNVPLNQLTPEAIADMLSVNTYTDPPPADTPENGAYKTLDGFLMWKRPASNSEFTNEFGEFGEFGTY